MIRSVFLRLADKTASDPSLPLRLWEEIEAHYSHPGRHYHTLSHLENLYKELENCRHLIVDEDTLFYTLFYHDIIYNAARQDNEEQSAVFARAHLQALGVNRGMQERCCSQIRATQSHAAAADNDTNLFTDADLSILGKSEAQYFIYCEQVRQEYDIYPDELYRPGRAKVLQHFLDMPQIYKTDFFRERYETQARRNIAQELVQLNANLP